MDAQSVNSNRNQLQLVVQIRTNDKHKIVFWAKKNYRIVANEILLALIIKQLAAKRRVTL